MVSSEEIRRRLEEKRKGWKRGYLVCDKCGSHYELREGESIDDFGSCQCDGNLKYVESIEEILKEENYQKFKDKLLNNDPQNLEDYAKNLIDLYGENYQEYMDFFRRLLKENGFLHSKKQFEEEVVGIIENLRFKAMKCDKHPEKHAIAICVSCEKGICNDCRVQLAGKNYCQECADKLFE